MREAFKSHVRECGAPELPAAHQTPEYDDDDAADERFDAAREEE